MKPIPSPNDPDGHSTRPFIFPLSSLAEVQAEYDDTLRLIDQATSRRPVSTVRLGEYLAGQYRWLERLQDQIEQMEAAA